MDQVAADIPDDQEVHVILDNSSIHKNNDAWLAAKPFVWRKREVKGSQLRNTIVNLCN
jgi:hypothetical protein